MSARGGGAERQNKARCIRSGYLAIGAGIFAPHAANQSLVTVCTKDLTTAIKVARKHVEMLIADDDNWSWQQDPFPGAPVEGAEGRLTITEAPVWLDLSSDPEAQAKTFKPSATEALYHKGGKP